MLPLNLPGRRSVAPPPPAIRGPSSLRTAQPPHRQPAAPLPSTPLNQETLYVQYQNSGNGITSKSPPRREPMLMQHMLPNPFEENFEEHGMLNVGGGMTGSPDLPVGAGAVKKKMGRPRKCAPDGLSPATSTLSVPKTGAEAAASGEPSQKCGREQPPGSGRK